MKDKKLLIYSVIGVLFMIILIVGVTYAWFSTSIEGDDITYTVTTAKLGPLYYEGGVITANNEVLPGWISSDVELKVYGEVTGEAMAKYSCTISNVGEVADVEYAEIVASISSKSAGPGTRANIDEFTQTTKKGLETVGGADKARAIIILNPAEPPVMMCNTIYTIVKNPDEKAIKEAVEKRLAEIQQYVPGYQLRVPPLVDGNKVTVIIQVEGAGDFLPKYSGNLDIINSAAISVAEKLAEKMLER